MKVFAQLTFLWGRGKKTGGLPNQIPVLTHKPSHFLVVPKMAFSGRMEFQLIRIAQVGLIPDPGGCLPNQLREGFTGTLDYMPEDSKLLWKTCRLQAIESVILERDRRTSRGFLIRSILEFINGGNIGVLGQVMAHVPVPDLIHGNWASERDYLSHIGLIVLNYLLLQ